MRRKYPPIEKRNPACQQWWMDLKFLKEKKKELGRAIKITAKISQEYTIAGRFNATKAGPAITICAGLRAEIKAQLVELRTAFPLLTAEDLKMLEQFEKDYHRSVKTLQEYQILDAQNGTAYTADFAEFAGRQYEVPSWSDIRKRLTARGSEARRKRKSILLMQQAGNLPRLQLTPIGKTINSLARAINEAKMYYKTIIKPVTVSGAVDDDTLQYFPEKIEWIPGGGGSGFIVKGAKSKTQVINENKGWLISIVEMKQVMDTPKFIALEDNPDLIREGSFKGFWNSKPNIRKYGDSSFRQIDLQMTGLTYEDYLVAQMDALVFNRVLDTEHFTALTGVFRNYESVPLAHINTGESVIYLTDTPGDHLNAHFRPRNAIRI